jgi:hypothetical protein
VTAGACAEHHRGVEDIARPRWSTQLPSGPCPNVIQRLNLDRIGTEQSHEPDLPPDTAKANGSVRPAHNSTSACQSRRIDPAPVQA